MTGLFSVGVSIVRSAVLYAFAFRDPWTLAIPSIRVVLQRTREQRVKDWRVLQGTHNILSVWQVFNRDATKG